MLGKQAKGLRDKVEARQRAIEHQKRELKEREATAKRLREEIQATNRLLRSYDDVLRTCVPHFNVPDEVRRDAVGLQEEEEEDVGGRDGVGEVREHSRALSVDEDGTRGAVSHAVQEASFPSSIAEEILTSFARQDGSMGAPVESLPESGLSVTPPREMPRGAVNIFGGNVDASSISGSPVRNISAKDAIMAFVASPGGSEDDIGTLPPGLPAPAPALAAGAQTAEEELLVKDL